MARTVAGYRVRIVGGKPRNLKSGLSAMDTDRAAGALQRAPGHVAGPWGRRQREEQPSRISRAAGDRGSQPMKRTIVETGALPESRDEVHYRDEVH